MVLHWIDYAFPGSSELRLLILTPRIFLIFLFSILWDEKKSEWTLRSNSVLTKIERGFVVVHVHEEHVLLEWIEVLLIERKVGLKGDVREIVELEIEVVPFGGALYLLVARRLHLLRAAA